MVGKLVPRAADVLPKVLPPVSFGGLAIFDLCPCVKTGPKLAKTTLEQGIPKMPLNSSSVSSIVSISCSRTTASGSIVTASTQFQDTPLFNNGTATVLTAAHCVDINLVANATALVLANLTTTLTETVTPTALKYLRISSAEGNSNLTVTASVLGLSAFPIQPGGRFEWITPTANGLTLTGNQTLLANGTANQTLRVTMLVN